MVITILKEKFTCTSKLYYSKVTKENLLMYLNSIIEWDLCLFPEILNDVGNKVPDSKFLGDVPELKAGNMFLFKNQIIAVLDEHTLVMPIVRTGIGGLQRVFDEYIDKEIDLFLNPTDDVEVLEYEIVDKIPSDYSYHYSPNYASQKIWKERFGDSMKNKVGTTMLKVKIGTEFIISPIVFYINNWNFFFKDEEDFYGKESYTELLRLISKSFYSEFYITKDRTVFPPNEISPFSQGEEKIGGTDISDLSD